MRIERCYDSHVHLLATGEHLSGLDLSKLTDAGDVRSLKILPQHFRGEWLVGFGWDQNKWPGQKFPSLKELDSVFPNTPVNFTRADGHASWINTAALKKLGLYNSSALEKPDPVGGQILRDASSKPTGILIDQAKILADLEIPFPTREQNKQYLIAAIQYFNGNGFSHIRDMSCTWQQWEILRELDQQKRLTLYIVENFTCENLKDLDRVFSEMQMAADSPSPHLKVGAVKIYCDGALGSEGALLSQNYSGTKSNGLRMWDLTELKTLATEVFKKKLPLAIHTIGDLASLEISNALIDLQSKGIHGEIHFEHLELADTQTLKNLKQLNATVHMQPCHFLTDIHFLKNKIGALYNKVFRWKDIEDLNIHLHFGSDAPIEAASVPNNLKAIDLANENSIVPFTKPFESYHQFPDPSWGKNCHTEFTEKALKLYFDGDFI